MSEAVGISTGSLLVLLLGVRNKEMNERIMGGEGIIIQKHPQMLKQLKKGSNRVLKKFKKRKQTKYSLWCFKCQLPNLLGINHLYGGARLGSQKLVYIRNHRIF